MCRGSAAREVLPSGNLYTAVSKAACGGAQKTGSFSFARHECGKENEDMFCYKCGSDRRGASPGPGLSPDYGGDRLWASRFPFWNRRRFPGDLSFPVASFTGVSLCVSREKTRKLI